MQRLMCRTHPRWIGPRCHRLDALALQRQQQTGRVVSKRHRTIRMPQGPSQGLDVTLEPLRAIVTHDQPEKAIHRE
jgi:hypothetical protein